MAREPELRRLQDVLEHARAGRGRVVVIAGEAGQGKTTLLRAFAEDALAKHADLLVLVGACNAYTGSGDPFLPFREVLEQLTGEVPTGLDLEPLDTTRAESLRGFTARACQTLLERGSQLVGTLLPAEAFLERAAQAGVAVPRGRSWGGGVETAPYQGVLGAASHGALSAATTRVFTAVADERPLLLLLDDLQWLDRNSAELLLHLAKVAAGHRILVLGAYRATDVAAEPDGQRHVLQGVVHEIERMFGDAVLDLDRADGRAFLEAWLDTQPNRLDGGFREALWRQTGGQPLFTIELLRAMQDRGDLTRDEEGRWSAARTLKWDALPRRVAGALAERVERLAPFASAILKVASIEGERFTAEAVALVLKREPLEVTAALGDELDRKHRLVGGVDVRRGANGLVSRYRFRHNLIQRFIYEGVDEGERSYLHEAVAEALEALLGDAADPMILAHHYARARMPDRAAIHHRRAGDQARKAAALDRAIEHYRTALQDWGGRDPAAGASILRDLGESQWLRGARHEARRSLGEALAGFRASGHRRAAGAVQLTMARTYYEDGDWSSALANNLEALATLEDGPETPELAWAQSSLSVLYATTLNHNEGLAWGRRALETAERVDAKHVRAQALTTVGMLLASSGPDGLEQGLRMLGESLDLSGEFGLTYESGRAAYNYGDVLRQFGRFDEAKSRWEQLLEYSREHRVALGEGLAMFQLWRLHWRQGEWTWCFAQRGLMLQLAEGKGHFPSPTQQVVFLLTSADVDIGLLHEASSTLERHEPILKRLVEPQYRCPYLCERLRIAVTLEHPESADTLAQEILETLRGKRYVDTVFTAALTALTWMASRPSDDGRAGALEFLGGLEEAEARYRTPEARAVAAEARGSIAHAQGDARAAAEHLLAAANHWRACGFPLDEARARGAAARQLALRGQGKLASSELARARALLANLGAQLPTKELRASFASVERDLLAASSA
ncbi:MAG: AAA family ATPase [Deinococcales bacterium]